MLFARWREQLLSALGAAREELDALNVFPVPDGDTGTNVYLTVEAAVEAADAAETAGAPLTEIGRAFTDGALRGARGNSGVILSQLFLASVPMLVRADPAADSVDSGRVLAEVLQAASDAAWAAVGEPVEGTILSVARAAAVAAAAATGRPDGAPLSTVLRAATTAAQQALEQTPQQLERLRQAGVVDAGGRALVVVLATTERVLTGRVDPAVGAPGRPTLPVPMRPPADEPLAAGPAYEVMYLLDAPDDAVPALRAALGPLGDSLVVVGDDGLWNVHVHVDDVGAAIEAGIVAGRPHRVLVTHFADQVDAPAKRARTGRAVVITAAGPGLVTLFRAAGAVVVEALDGRHARAPELLAALLASAAGEAVLLPNDRAAAAAAEAAAHQAREHGVRVAVIPTRAQVQGLAALAVHDPGRSFDDDVVHMSAAAGQTRDGAVTVATRQAMTTAGPCEPGDVLGVVAGDFALVGADAFAVTVQVVERLLAGSGELVTVLAGAAAPPGLVERVQRHVGAQRPDVDVQVHDGGQAGYLLLLAVE